MDIKDILWRGASDVRHKDGWSSIVAGLLEQIDGIVGRTEAAIAMRQIEEKLGELRF